MPVLYTGIHTVYLVFIENMYNPLPSTTCFRSIIICASYSGTFSFLKNQKPKGNKHLPICKASPLTTIHPQHTLYIY